MSALLAYIEQRLLDMGSRCDWRRTHERDRNGYKPRGDILKELGLYLFDVRGPDHVEFMIGEHRDEDNSTIHVRTFPYSRDELEAMADELNEMINRGEQGYALEWNWLQLRRAAIISSQPELARKTLALQAEKAKPLAKIAKAAPVNYIPGMKNGLSLN